MKIKEYRDPKLPVLHVLFTNDASEVLCEL